LKYNGELAVVDPASLPVNLWLEGCEPWIPKDYFVFSQVREEESEGMVLHSHLYLQVHEILEFSTLVWGAIDIK
jgi:hypothetical protein